MDALRARQRGMEDRHTVPAPAADPTVRAELDHALGSVTDEHR